MDPTVASIIKDNERIKAIKSMIVKLKHGELSDSEIESSLLPNIRFLHQVGASGLFQEAIGLIGNKYEDLIDFQICKMLECIDSFDYVGTSYWLRKIRLHKGLTLVRRALLSINIIFVNANAGSFDYNIDSAIDDLEQLICKDHYFTFEGLENLMQELESNVNYGERLNRYVDFLKTYRCESWQVFNWMSLVLFHHYRRTNDYINLRLILNRYSNAVSQYNLSENERLRFDIFFLRLLFECRDGRWEDYSISLLKNRKQYLDSDIDIVLSFIREVSAIIRDGANVYGRYLNPDCISAFNTDAYNALTDFINDNKGFPASLELELLHSHRYWLEIIKEQLYSKSAIYNLDIHTFLKELKNIQNSILNLCEINRNNREYLHWLLCFADELKALAPEIDVTPTLKDMAIKLSSLLETAKYSASVSYYMIFLADIWDYLGETDKAKDILRHYNNSGANIKVYNLSIQNIYISLEDKYRLLPPDERRFLMDNIILLTNLNSSREIQEALIRAENLLESIDITDQNYVVKAGPKNLIFLLLKCSHIFLNANRFDLVDQVWRKANVLMDYWKYEPDIKAEFDYVYATSLFRGSDCDAAYEILKHLENHDIDERLKLKALILMGDIESKRSWPGFNLNPLSKALALAEKLGDPKDIAGIYHKIGVSFGPFYPALGISFFRKAETIYSQLGLIDELYATFLLRAQASMLIHLAQSNRYDNKTQPLLNEARRILEENPRSRFKSESSRAFHDRITGIINCDADKFKDAYLFYHRINSYDNILLVLENAVICCSLNGRRNDALSFAQLYLKEASIRHDQKYIAHAIGMIDCLNTPDGIILFPITPRPYKETTLLDILDDLSFKEELWALDKSPIRRHFPYPCDEGKCLPFKNKNVVTLSPICLLPFTYYRGQSQRHYPCKPTLYRPKMTDALQFIERLKYCEFHLLLETHPLCTKFRNTFKLSFPDGKEEVLNFNIYHLALAQHYGICTELIDLTSDKWVAAFFAATQYDNGQYYPYDKDGKGVFYTCEETDPTEPKIRPIGIQPFSRPGEQRGYAFPLSKDDDFESSVTITEFKHYPEINEFIFNYTNRSLRLFPKDILKDKADAITDSHTFSKTAFDMTVLKFYPETGDKLIAQWLSEGEIKIVNDPIVKFTASDIKEYGDNLPSLFNAIRDNILVLNLGCRTDYGNVLYSMR